MKKVLFAESDKEFVDVLFSFLIMPLGTIVRVLGKQSQMGCLDEVYKSVEDLSADFFQTKACKAMLLKPLNAASRHCRRLKINVDDTKPRAVYVCKDTSCCAHGDGAFSSFPDAVCRCGKAMEYVGDALDEGDLALTGGAREIISLLKRSLMSKQPLTGLYFDYTITNDDADVYVLPEKQNDADQKLNIEKIKVLQTKNNSLLYVEGDAEFVDLLFGLLSIPLGSIIKAFGQWPPSGCVDNLWKSIDHGSGEGSVRPECQSLLLSPMAAPFGSGAAKVLEVDELAPTLDVNCCFKCFKTCGFAETGRCRQQYYCGEMVKTTKLCELNPKAPKGGNGNGETYVKGGHMKFLVTDDLHVLPLLINHSTSSLRCKCSDRGA
ncbi:hypothetical protein PVAP13_7KG318146 [Panicum virgatum]|uniref:Uncharacterized protein n=1 Tax=Panicum virgatum TaxID=38727 RepID=A0A8T0QL55_PANVG|nr:hypothetical protein PVAP13_7KG318146 [Panicum virgatum]